MYYDTNEKNYILGNFHSFIYPSTHSSIYPPCIHPSLHQPIPQSIYFIPQSPSFRTNLSSGNIFPRIYWFRPRNRAMKEYLVFANTSLTDLIPTLLFCPQFCPFHLQNDEIFFFQSERHIRKSKNSIIVNTYSTFSSI